MVQRKVSNKLGIHADQDKSNKLLVNLKPSTLQHQDAKNKGADLKKKMKKSRPIKLSDLERLGSPNMRRQVPQPGKPPPPKPPPPVFPNTSASPQKSPVKTPETAPNYMKATTSSDARKERSQVSSRNLQTLFDSQSSGRKDSNSSKMSSGSVHKAARVLGRTSSSKLVRTLTKTTSFKPARASAKKCSPLVLSENLNVQRATCSSTLKDSKFPAYLALSSGATEAEGTSVMKVCPYTYCSLNGHHHPPLPPLKSFLSARRRLLKTQRSFKLGCLSPRRSKPVSSSTEEIQVEQNHEKSSSQEPWDSSMSSPVIEEKQTDFFVQIYGKGRETKVDITDSSLNHIRPAVEGRPSGGETPTQVDNRQVLAIPSDESPFSEMDSHDDSSKIIDAASSVIEVADYCEAESYSTMDLDYEPDSSLQSIQDSDLGRDSPEFGSCIIPEVSIFKSAITNRCFGEIQAGTILKQSSDEESIDRESVSSKASSFSDYWAEDYVEGLDDGSHDELGLQFKDESFEPIKTQDLIDYLKDGIVQNDVEAEQVRGPDSQDFHDMIEESCEDGMEENEQGDPFKAPTKIEICISLHSSAEATGDMSAKDCKDNNLEDIRIGGKSDRTLANMELTKGAPDQSAHDNSISSGCENLNCLEENEAGNFKTIASADLGGEKANPTPKNACGGTQNDRKRSLSCQELAETCKRRSWRTGCKRSTEEYQELKEFNPKAPNFLPLEPGPEAEKVDLRHQTIDERRNADEWMLDYAIQKAVNKLGPARKKKVALLVEAFETVMPVPRYDTQPSHSSFSFSHARSIQACS
nr:uncharacterized protein LOC113732482 isoform X1 [Coffea arabica]